MATSIVHVHVYNKPVIKTIHHAMNIMTTEAKLFTIRCGINQTTNIPSISKIVIITDMLHAAQRIFNSSTYLFQIHLASI